MAYTSIVFGALGVLLGAASIGLASGVLGFVALAAAIVGGVLGVMSRATREGKAGLALSIVSVVFFVAFYGIFMPRSMSVRSSLERGPVVEDGKVVQTPPAK